MPDLFEVVEGDRLLLFDLKDKIENILQPSPRRGLLQTTVRNVEEKSVGAADLDEDLKQKANEQLKNLIMNYVQNNLKDVSETNMQLIKNIDCNVNMNENKAKISCSFCSYKTTVYFTIMNVKTGKRKWVPSNFTRHLKICLTNKTSGIVKKKSDNKQGNLLSFVHLRSENVAEYSTPGPSTRPDVEPEILEVLDKAMDESEDGCDLEQVAGVSSLDKNSESSVESDKDATSQTITKESVLLSEHYYSVYFDEDWFIGRIIKSDDNNRNNTHYVIKFLEKNFDKFVWPKREDIQQIKKEFIFYGPIQLEGNEPFTVKKNDTIKIKAKYKSIKRDFRSR